MKADDTPDTFPSVDEQLLADYPELAELIDAEVKRISVELERALYE